MVEDADRNHRKADLLGGNFRAQETHQEIIIFAVMVKIVRKAVQNGNFAHRNSSVRESPDNSEIGAFLENPLPLELQMIFEHDLFFVV